MTAERLFLGGLLGGLLLAGGLVLGCGDKDDTGGAGDSGTADGGGGDGGSTLDGSWASVETAMSNSCAFSSCHGGNQFPDLTVGNSYDAIVEVESEDLPGEILVVPGDADASYLVAKCEGADGIEGVAMPKGSDSWDADNLANLRAWIDAGALAE